ncbi:hypothetical protein DL93DRAFT_2053738 [Clavulina sp. PMI_390]|nr:hypothetical protein DL93DRAFT_2053738 [Clavulina sp. PMI_390]
MSSLTTSDIIASAAYLRDDFDPKSLTVAQLRGLLNHHGIPYTAAAKKSQLLALFEQNISDNLDELRDQRMAIDGSQASDRGITDGISGRQINDPETPPQPRRSSRRGSARPASTEPQAEQSKPRRASAAPSAGPTRSRSRTAPQPAIPEVVESDSEDEVPTRPIRKSTKGEPPALLTSQDDEESGWEHDNVFQSGPEDSPPSRPAPRRSSLNPSTLRTPSRLSESSTNAPQPIASVSRPSRGGSSLRFTGPLHHEVPVTPAPRGSATRLQPSIRAPVTPQVPPSVPEEEEEEDDDDASTYERANHAIDESNAVSSRFSGNVARKSSPSKSQAVARRTQPPPDRSFLATFSRFFVALFVVLSLTQLGLYRRESRAIGYCDAGSDSNSFLDEKRADRAAAQVCNARLLASGPDEGQDPHSRIVDGVACELEPLIPLPQPDVCTPCPKRATCEGRIALCSGAFIPQPHPIVKYSSIAETIFGGMPGFGPVAFPIACVEDGRYRKQVGKVANNIEEWLAKGKGQMICDGRIKPGVGGDSKDGGDAKAWGSTIDHLKEMISQRLAVIWHKTIDDALEKMEEVGLIITGIDSDGVKWVASLKTDMPLSCKIKVAARTTWDAWRMYLYTVLFLFGAGVYGRVRISASRAETQHVAALVQMALETLRQQELAHHIDPVSHPHGYLSSMHLRDHVLQEEHSTKKRQRLWAQVEKVVEGNANVRATMEEVGGDETRAWQWTGGTAAIANPSPRKVQWNGGVQEENGA